MWPDICGFLAMLYGTGGVDLSALTVWHFGNATGVVFTGNPPYTATDFLGWYPKFFGPATVVSTTLTLGQATFPVADTTGLAVGQLLLNLNSVPKDTVITAINTGTKVVTMSNMATANDTTISIYEAPPMPLVIILWFVFQAGASVMQERYQESWPFAMALFIAHFCTMYMRSESGANATAAQIVATGLERGLLVGKSAGDVSANIKFLDGFEEWGAMAETTYGTQFISMSKVVNAGPVWVR